MPPTEGLQVDKPIQPKIGIIYPPPEVRNIVDKTANFVARNGPDFESRIRQNEINNSKFNFLNPADPYHAYYQYKVKEFADGKVPEPAGIKLTTPSAARLAQDTPKAIQETFTPKDPPTEYEFIYDPPSINAIDIDIIKLTAQFVARNGRQFLTQLMNREQRNYQFDFLRTQHNMFGYFTKLVEQYTKILIPPKDVVSKLGEVLEKPKQLLEDVKYRVDWHKYQERQRKREEEAAERERVAYAMIDWHDFVVVETVDFQPNETGNFPLPTTPDEVGARILAEERGMQLPSKTSAPPPPGSLGLMPTDLDDEANSDSDYEPEVTQAPISTDKPEINKAALNYEAQSQDVDDNAPTPPHLPFNVQGEDDMELSDDEDTVASFSQTAKPKQVPLTNDQVIIRHDYNPKAVNLKKVDDSLLLISPFTGEKISSGQAPKHIRVGLLDPKWVEQRDREIREKREQEQVYASGNLIDSSLKQLAERRSDIFGVGVDEIQIGKKLGEEELIKSDKLIWDGYSASTDALNKRALESITPKDKADLLEYQQNLEAAKDKIGVQSGISSTGQATTPVVPNPVMLMPPHQVASINVQPPPMPPQGLILLGGAPPPPPLAHAMFPPGMPPPPGINMPTFMHPLIPPMPMVVPNQGAASADGEPEAKRPRE